jgi:hypothetical protein
MKIYAISRTATPNVGDIYSSPRLYSPFLREAESVDIKQLTVNSGAATDASPPNFGGAALVVGGGGLLDNAYFDAEIELIAHSPGPALKVLWGVGQNFEQARDMQRLFRSRLPDLSPFDLVGVRDYPNPWRWTPCASCLHDVFQRPAAPATREVVTFLHHDRRRTEGVEADLPNAMHNDEADFLKVIDHLSSGDLVLTNSYHGAYWAQLLGRKVLAFPTSTKMLHFRFPVPFCEPDAWRRHARFAYVADEALRLSVEANRDFAQRVAERLEDVSRAAPRCLQRKA